MALWQKDELLRLESSCLPRILSYKAISAYAAISVMVMKNYKKGPVQNSRPGLALHTGNKLGQVGFYTSHLAQVMTLKPFSTGSRRRGGRY